MLVSFLANVESILPKNELGFVVLISSIFNQDGGCCPGNQMMILLQNECIPLPLPQSLLEHQSGDAVNWTYSPPPASPPAPLALLRQT